MLDPACDDTQTMSSMVQLLPHVSRPGLVGQPSAEPKFHRRSSVARTKPSTHALACPGGPQPGSRSLAPEMTTR